jgi:hypothetical protein
MRATMRVAAWRLMLGVASVPLVGCDSGPRIVPASGQVLMNGKPLTGFPGFVRVVPKGFRAATGRIDPADGRFSHPASVIVNQTVGNRLFWIVPETYGNDATSGLKLEISGSTSGLELNLEGKLTPAPAPTEAERRLQEAG